MEQRDHQVGEQDEKDIDVGQYEGGAEAEKGKSVAGAEEKKELTPEEEAAEKAEKAEKLAIANAKAKELLFGYIGQFRCLMIAGFVLNILGMVGEFVSPLFIGWVVDAIVAAEPTEVRRLIIWWMIFNTAGAFFAGMQRFVFQMLTEKIG